MTETFAAATALDRLGGGRYGGAVDASWYQGRGAFGGIVAGALLRACALEVDDPRRVPRSLTVHFASPLEAGPYEIAVTTERAGGRVTQLSARVGSPGATVAFGTATFGAARGASVTYAESAMPAAPPVAEAQPFPRAPFVPTFLQHFDLRLLAECRQLVASFGGSR